MFDDITIEPQPPWVLQWQASVWFATPGMFAILPGTTFDSLNYGHGIYAAGLSVTISIRSQRVSELSGVITLESLGG